MQLHLGKFDELKLGDKLLLCGGAVEMDGLAACLGGFVASGADAIPIHSRAVVSPSHPAKLFAVSSPNVTVDGHAWVCNARTIADISGKLSALSSGGHHYFELAATDVELLVSVGEYNLAWWQAQV